MRWMNQTKAIEGLVTPDSTTRNAEVRAAGAAHRVLIGRRDITGRSRRFCLSLSYRLHVQDRKRPPPPLRRSGGGRPSVLAEWSLYNATVTELFSNLQVDVESDTFAVWTFLQTGWYSCVCARWLAATTITQTSRNGVHPSPAQGTTRLWQSMPLLRQVLRNQEPGLKSTLWHILDV